MKVSDIREVLWLLPDDMEIISMDEIVAWSEKNQYPLSRLKVGIRAFNSILRASQKMDSFRNYSPYKINCTMDLVLIYKEHGEKGLLRIANLGKRGVKEVIAELKRLHPDANIS